MRASIRVGGVLWLAVLGLGFAAPVAGAYVYWAAGETGTIGRAANEKGGPVEPGFITGAGTPAGVAVDSAHVYWPNEIGESIGRANLDGSGVEPGFIKLPYQPTGIAVDATHIYWSASAVAKVGRAKIDGTAPEPDFLTGLNAPCGVAVDAGHVYWVGGFTPAYVGRAPLSGPPANPEYVTIEHGKALCGIGVNTTNIFWTDFGLGAGTNVGRANLSNGLGVDESFIGQALGPCGIAVFGSQLYWVNAGTATIGRANTDSTGADYELIKTGAEPNRICGIAVDALAPPPPGGGQPPDTTPPQTTISAGPGRKLARGRAKFSFSSSEAGSNFQCKLDRKKVDGCRSPKSYSGLKPGHHTFDVWATDPAGNKDPTPAKRRFRVPG